LQTQVDYPDHLFNLGWTFGGVIKGGETGNVGKDDGHLFSLTFNGGAQEKISVVVNSRAQSIAAMAAIEMTFRILEPTNFTLDNLTHLGVISLGLDGN
jgi:hypothetical protein